MPKDGDNVYVDFFGIVTTYYFYNGFWRWQFNNDSIRAAMTTQKGLTELWRETQQNGVLNLYLLLGENLMK